MRGRGDDYLVARWAVSDEITCTRSDMFAIIINMNKELVKIVPPEQGFRRMFLDFHTL